MDSWLNKKDGTIFRLLLQYNVCQTIHLCPLKWVVESNGGGNKELNVLMLL